MKSDSAVPNDESQQHGLAGVDESRPEAGKRPESDRSASSHDLRASLAIVNGFSAALGASFQDLSDQYSEIIELESDKISTESTDRLMMLDADCRFCLSRLRTSIDQLKHRLATEHEILNPDQLSDSEQ